MSKVYKFNEQLKIGKEGEAKLDKFFKEELGMEIVNATKEEELESGFDRIFHKNGRQCYIEYKTDEKALHTGNIFIETLSVSTTNKKGWVLTSKAYRVAILVGSHIYLLKIEDLRNHIITEGDKYRLAKSKNDTYYSEGRLLPITKLKKLKSFKEYTL